VLPPRRRKAEPRQQRRPALGPSASYVRHVRADAILTELQSTPLLLRKCANSKFVSPQLFNAVLFIIRMSEPAPLPDFSTIRSKKYPGQSRTTNRGHGEKLQG